VDPIGRSFFELGENTTRASEGYMKLHARQKYDYRDLERRSAVPISARIAIRAQYVLAEMKPEGSVSARSNAFNEYSPSR